MPRSYKSLSRLYVTEDLGTGHELTLEREQTNYLINVMRLGAGDAVVLFNGRDGAFRAEVTDPHRKGVTLRCVELIAAQTPPADLWFGFAPLKIGRLDYLVQKATEMGAGVIRPVITRYTQVHRLKADKLEANIIEAAEQCEVLSVPRLGEEIALADLVAGWTAAEGARRLIFCDESEPSGSPLSTLAPLARQPVGILVGPEGGFSDEERELLLAQDFVIPISLGPRILRADTAAVAAMAVVQSIIGDWR